MSSDCKSCDFVLNQNLVLAVFFFFIWYSRVTIVVWLICENLVIRFFRFSDCKVVKVFDKIKLVFEFVANR
ncbi:hypothetical protein Hdeb2414_s0011g00369161 [Helianthus debilis subsp. tardiflorus]